MNAQGAMKGKQRFLSCCHPERSETKSKNPVATPIGQATGSFDYAQDDGAEKRSAQKEKQRAGEVAKVLRILHQWGVHSLGQLAALEQQELAARLGPVAAELWERASGKATRLLKLVTPAETFEEAFEFEQEVETMEPLLFILRRFLEQFSVRLDACYLVTKELTLRITFADKKTSVHEFKIPEPTNNFEVLFRMLHTHLESFTSQAPITAIVLQAFPAKPGQQQFNLFETALRDPAQLAETLARLTALVGPERMGMPVLEDTHRADAFRMEPFRWELAGLSPEELPALPAKALRRFRENLAALVLVADGKPAHLRSPAVQGRVAESEGPYVSSGDWWDRAAWQRAEWDLELEDGAICRCHAEGERWELDGFYD